MWIYRGISKLLLVLLAGCATSNEHPGELMFPITAHGDKWEVRRVHCVDIPTEEIIGFVDSSCPIIGYTEPELHTVYILIGQTPADEREVVVHELMHVAVGVEHSRDVTTIHGAIYSISPEFTSILENNSELLTYLEQGKATTK